MIDIKWENPSKTIIRITFDQEWTLIDFIQLVSQSEKMISETSESVDVIVDSINNKGFPRNINMIPHLKRSFSLVKFEKIVFVGGSIYAKALLKVFLTVYPHWQQKMYFSDTIDEAKSLISDKQPATHS